MEVHFHNVRDFAFNKHRQIDDTVLWWWCWYGNDVNH